jgi:hypothetical protein
MHPDQLNTKHTYDPKAKFKLEINRSGYLMLCRLFTQMHPAEWESQSHKLCAVTLYQLGQDMLKKSIDQKSTYKLSIDFKAALAFNEFYQYLYHYYNDEYLRCLLQNIYMETDKLTLN